MRMLLRVCLIAVLLVCYVQLSCASKYKRRKGEEFQGANKNTDSTIEAETAREKVKKTGSKKMSIRPRSDTGCTKLGGICQSKRFICQGRYLKDKCSGAKTQNRHCCMPVGAWSVLCAGHHNNRVRACDAHGCGAFNSRGGKGFHKAVDLVCDDYGIVNAPFSGSLAGPVSQKDSGGNQYDGLKLLNDVHCVKIFNIRPFRYIGLVSQGEPLGYVLPLQERFSGITSHLELQMCDGTDPSPLI
ncbi:hypothetical protein PAMP_007267 [Pampus punctatissimus]